MTSVAAYVCLWLLVGCLVAPDWRNSDVLMKFPFSFTTVCFQDGRVKHMLTV